jgi:hypothetical protein
MKADTLWMIQPDIGSNWLSAWFQRRFLKKFMTMNGQRRMLHVPLGQIS